MWSIIQNLNDSIKNEDTKWETGNRKYYCVISPTVGRAIWKNTDIQIIKMHYFCFLNKIMKGFSFFYLPKNFVMLLHSF